MLRMKQGLPNILMLFGFVSMSLPAAAHSPVDNDGSHSTSDNAIVISDPGLSQVVYHEVTPEQPEIWLTFEGMADQEVFVQLGIPVIDELEDYRPSVAIIEAEEQATKDEALIFDSSDATPELFFEPFTGTSSYILVEETVSLPHDGQYFVRAYHPSSETGKLWVAIGQREEFGLELILDGPRIVFETRAFHDVLEEPMPISTRIVLLFSYIITGLLRALGFA